MTIGHRETAVLVTQHLRDGGGFILLADDVPVGSVRWLPLETENHIWEILRMGVLPAWRGKNISQHLLEAIIHHGLETGVEELRMAVRADQPKLIDFYTAFEFELAEELEYTHANPLEPAPFAADALQPFRAGKPFDGMVQDRKTALQRLRPVNEG
eukprot:gene28063-34860_t